VRGLACGGGLSGATQGTGGGARCNWAGGGRCTRAYAGVALGLCSLPAGCLRPVLRLSSLASRDRTAFRRLTTGAGHVAGDKHRSSGTPTWHYHEQKQQTADANAHRTEMTNMPATTTTVASTSSPPSSKATGPSSRGAGGVPAPATSYYQQLVASSC
jgi:hypothetical protein